MGRLVRLIKRFGAFEGSKVHGVEGICGGSVGEWE